MFERNLSSSLERSLRDFPIIPIRYGIERRVSSTPRIAYAGKYELIVKHCKFAFIVVWNPRISIYSSAIGSHYQLIFREVGNDNRPRGDLGKCWVRNN